MASEDEPIINKINELKQLLNRIDSLRIKHLLANVTWSRTNAERLMGRSSNDDRSDSMNPNNPAYWAAEVNHRNQVGEAHSPHMESNWEKRFWRGDFLPPKEPFQYWEKPYDGLNLYLYVLRSDLCHSIYMLEAYQLEKAIFEVERLWNDGNRVKLVHVTLFGKDAIHFSVWDDNNAEPEYWRDGDREKELLQCRANVEAAINNVQNGNSEFVVKPRMDIRPIRRRSGLMSD